MIAHVPTLDVEAAVRAHRASTRRRRELERRADIELDTDLVAALAWCGGNPATLGRPIDDEAYHRAKQLGLLAQDSTWRATTQGQGVLVAVGLIDGAPAPERATVHVLWAACQRFPRPQFVGAWTDGFVDMRHEQWRQEVTDAMNAYGPDDGPWTFWETAEHIDVPETPIEEPL